MGRRQTIKPYEMHPKMVAKVRDYARRKGKAFPSSNGSAAAMRKEIAELKARLKQQMRMDRTARTATTRWGMTIYTLRAARGMTCTELARACKRTPAYVTNMEIGKKHNPRLKTIENLATAFGIKASELIAAYEKSGAPLTPELRHGVKPRCLQ